MSTQTTSTETDQSSRAIWQRLGGLFGLAAVGLIIAGKAIGDPNGTTADINPDQSGLVIANRLIEHRDAIERGTSLLVIGVFFFLAFVAWVANRYRSERPSERWLTYAAVGGGVAAAALMLVEAAIMIAAIELESTSGDEAVASTIAAFTWNWVNVIAAPLAAFTAAISVGVIRSGRRQAVIGWIGLTFAAISLIPSLTWAGVSLALVWIAVLSIVQLVEASLRGRVVRQDAPLPHGA